MSKPKRRITPGYLFFYIVFSADSWRLLCGLVISILLTPHLSTGRELTTSAQVVLGFMLVAIGWWVSAKPMEKWAAFLRDKMRSFSQ